MSEQKKHKEIDLVMAASQVVKEWKTLIKFVVPSIILGIIVALSIPKTYTASVVLAPEFSSGGAGLSGSIADMASKFGVDLGKSGKNMDALYPEIYPEIFASTDFIVGLFDVPVRTKKDNTPRTYITHIQQDYKAPFWDYPKAWIVNLLTSNRNSNDTSEKDVFKMSKIDSELCAQIRGSISCLVDKKTSVITIGVVDQDPLAAAILADTLQKRLQGYIINYRTKKARNDYNYYMKLYKEAQAQYKKAQQDYAIYSDANQETILQIYRTKQEELENEMQLKYNLYMQLTGQLQTAKAKIQEKTPAFTIIERPMMPYKSSSTPRSFIVAFFAVLGCIVDALWILWLKDRFQNFKKK